MFSEINLQGVKGVLLDLDNTVYAYDPCHSHALGICMTRLQKDTGLDKETCLDLYNRSRKRVHDRLHGQGASHSRLLYFQALWEEINDSTDYAKTLEYDTLYWNSFLDVMQIDTNAEKFLANCQQVNIPVAVVTDLTTEIQHRKILKLGIAPYIKYMVSSEEAGKEKPEPEAFLMALKKLNLTPAEVIMIGDSLKSDKAGAEALGIRWYHPL